MTVSEELLGALSAKAGVTLAVTIGTEAWHSADLSGERIVLEIRLSGPNAPDHAARLVHGIEDHDFALVGRFVASVRAGPIRLRDGGADLRIEALLLDYD